MKLDFTKEQLKEALEWQNQLNTQSLSKLVLEDAEHAVNWLGLVLHSADYAQGFLLAMKIYEIRQRDKEIEDLRIILEKKDETS